MNNPSSNKLIWWVIVLVVAVVLVAWWLLRQGPTTNPAAVGSLDQTASGTVATSTETGASVTVNDQFPGSVIFITDVNLPNGGWVVIRKNNQGLPGQIMGVGYFDAKTHVGEVGLSKPTADNEQYFATLYSDNGDQRFNSTSDQPILTANNEPVQTTFNVTRNLPERKG